MLMNWAKMMGCRLGILLSVFDRKELRELVCHAFVNEMSFDCFALYEPRIEQPETICVASQP
jgi:hypothetical protein